MNMYIFSKSRLFGCFNGWIHRYTSNMPKFCGRHAILSEDLNVVLLKYDGKISSIYLSMLNLYINVE